MALRLKIRKEIKLTLEEDGFTQEEIKEQLNDLVEEELQRQDKERQSQQEFEERERERQSQQEIEILNNEKEIELRKLELEKNSNERNNEEQSELSSNFGKYEDTILAYDESTNISVWLDYFEDETEGWNEKKKIRYFKRSFMKSKGHMVLEKTSQCSYEELKNLILDYYQVSAEEFRLKFRKTYQDDKTLKMYVIELKSYLNKWMELSKVEDFDTLKTLILKEKFSQCLPYE